ncbi:MAG: histidine kinase [Cyanobacteria bacterium P01_A01_bin.123]
MEGMAQPIAQPDAPLKLLLFIDQRPSSAEQIQEIRRYLNHLKGDYAYQLDVIDVGEQPYLAEYFRLVATPALIKIAPLPQQTLAGSNIITQLDHWWPLWQQAIAESPEHPGTAGNDTNLDSKKLDAQSSIAHSAEVIKLSDEIFRLNQIKDELSAQLLFKDHIIAMLAHDLRNPLTAASIAVETLEMGHEKPQRRAHMTPALTLQLLKQAKTQIRAIDRMITDILQAARGASAELQIQPQQLNLQNLCLEVVDSLRSKFQAKEQHFTTDIPQDLPQVYADRSQVRQVLVNLMDNAIKYTPPGGRVDIVALHRTTQKVQVSIHDTGPGIPLENREKIFEDSFRLKRDRAKDGYGLGLALCQRIIRAHYGQIWVDSVPNRGSYFHFTLPVFKR